MDIVLTAGNLVVQVGRFDCAYVCVVQVGTQRPGVLHQVVLRPDKRVGDLIRLGETPGDEFNGWLRLANIEVVEVLGRAEEDGGWKCVPLTAEDFERAA